jgi:hypothetical protein
VRPTKEKNTRKKIRKREWAEGDGPGVSHDMRHGTVKVVRDGGRRRSGERGRERSWAWSE